MKPRKKFASTIGLTAALAVAVTTALSAAPAQAAPVAATKASAAAAAPAISPAPPIPTPPPILWGPCEDSNLQTLHAKCGYVTVPLDYDHPAGAKFQLAVSDVPHTTSASKYQGIMLVNPGGPGGSGLTLSILTAFVPDNAGASYDWIGFDPRGVGSSKPALSCIPNYFTYNRPNYIPSTAALTQIWLKRSKAYATACGKANLPLLQHMKTVNSAKDMESIRLALGKSQINYYGFSYGTYLGQVYSTLFPTRVRRMVLDSNVDPQRVWYQANLDQDVAFNRNINIWFGWLAKYDSVYHLGKTQQAVHDLWYKQRLLLAQKPAGGIIGPDEWTDTFLGAGYYQLTWLELGAAFAGWIHNGDYQTLKAEYDSSNSPTDDNGFAVYAAVQCTDVQWPQQYSTWERDNWAVYAKAPFETWDNAWFNAPCLYWPAAPGLPTKVDGSKVAPALLIDETLDAATPYPGSLETRKLFPKSVLLAEPGGTSHADSLFGNACVDDTIARYLATGALPTRKAGNNADTYCAPLPEPVPSASGAVAAPSALAKSMMATRVLAAVRP